VAMELGRPRCEVTSFIRLVQYHSKPDIDIPIIKRERGITTRKDKPRLHLQRLGTSNAAWEQPDQVQPRIISSSARP